MESSSSFPCQNEVSGRVSLILCSGGALRDGAGLSIAGNLGKGHPNQGLSGESRLH